MAGRHGLMQFLIPKADDRAAVEGRPLQIEFAARVELSAEFSEGFTRTASGRVLIDVIRRHPHAQLASLGTSRAEWNHKVEQIVFGLVKGAEVRAMPYSSESRCVRRFHWGGFGHGKQETSTVDASLTIARRGLLYRFSTGYAPS
jgi:hypothetical protein